MKICTKCKLLKSHEEFHKQNNTKTGYYSSCKSCCRELKVKLYAKNAEKEKSKSREYRKTHVKEIKEKAHERYSKYWEKNKEEIKKKHRAKYHSNKEAYNKQCSEYRKRTKDKQNAKTRRYQASVIQRLPKCANLGKIEQFYTEAHRLTRETGIQHEVDHIIPLRGKLVSGFHVEWNLQILTKSDNSSKGNKII